jgi:hypothetical protein
LEDLAEMNLKLFVFAVLSGLPAAALPLSFDCNRGIPLQTAIDLAFPGETLFISGSCAGPLTITGKNLTLAGNPTATITGQAKKDVVTVKGPARVNFKDLDIQGGNNGIVGSSGAQLTIVDTNIHNNAGIGILLRASTASLSGGSTNHNGFNGVDAEGTSAVTISGSYTSESNTVFGININGSSSLTLTKGILSVAHNTLGLQIGTSAGAFISDADSAINALNNAATGLTVVSGGQLVDFGGAITATGNGFHGVSVDSKAGLDLDAAATLTSTGNTVDGVHLEETSVMTIFNTPAFSGAPGTTTLVAQNNGANGISILTGSNLTMVHQAAITSTGNTKFGIQVDNGSGLTLVGSNITQNQKDVALTFGSRGDLSTSTIGTITCDATVLLRGDTGATCPK